MISAENIITYKANDNSDNEWLEKFLSEYQEGAAARECLVAYAKFAHAMDDVIDENKKSPSELLAVTQLHAAFMSTAFYLKYVRVLYPCVVLASIQYDASVAFEQDQSVRWKREAFDILRHSGLNLAIMVVYILGGNEAACEYTKIAYESAYYKHHDKDGNII